jgi:hypothetical protein
MTGLDQATSRRGFLSGGVAAAAGAASLVVSRLDALPAARGAAPNPDGWLDRLQGEDRLLLDSPNVRDATILFYVMHFYNTHNRDHGNWDGEVNAVSALYGPTTPFALNDAIWAKHRLGEFAEIQDPERDAPATANPWRRKPRVRGELMAEASVEALQARGAVFLVCDLALGGLAARLAHARGGSASELHDEFRANLLPGVVPVPNVVVSIQRAERRGLPYYRL